MGFLIPAARPNPGLLTRLGRLLHWTALGLAALMLIPAYLAATQLASAPVQPAPARMGQANPFDRFDAPNTSAGELKPAAPAAGPWTQYAPAATVTEYGYAVVGPNLPTAGTGADASARTADPWAAFNGVAPSTQQAPVISAPLSIHQQGLPYEFWLVAAVAFALVGRAARYLFAGE